MAEPAKGVTVLSSTQQICEVSSLIFQADKETVSVSADADEKDDKTAVASLGSGPIQRTSKSSVVWCISR